MLKVTIVNIDGPFIAVFDHDDKPKAVEAVLASLIADHGFFADNRIVPIAEFDFTPAYDGAYGVLLMEGEEVDEWQINGENTYWIYVTEYKSGTVISAR